MVKYMMEVRKFVGMILMILTHGKIADMSLSRKKEWINS